ncbi:MAG TPA: non-canonical purine NTP pyrophosphatase [Planctomycetaceae bacterium]|nr:non-canonical purine NTP pyrophosphatase [Planctomycetaceae bacterium]
MARPLIVLGTNNRKKGIELAELLEPVGIAVRTLADFDRKTEVVEDGDTFAANAAKKATRQAQFLGHWVLGEDSGLSIDSLGGAPGVYSARFSGEGADDASNNRLLLEKLGSLPIEKRTGHYTCHATLADPEGRIRAESEGVCRGRIRFTPSGNGGFGYDPLFEVVEYHRTFGEMSGAVKQCISHRAKALRCLIAQLPALLGEIGR